MKITRQQIEKILGLDEWLPTEQLYLTVSPEEMQRYMDRYPEIIGYIKGVRPCSAIARSIISKIVDARGLDLVEIKTGLALAIGEILVNKWRGVKKAHHANFFIDHDGQEWHFDMQLHQMWRANESDDEVFFAIM